MGRHALIDGKKFSVIPVPPNPTAANVAAPRPERNLAARRERPRPQFVPSRTLFSADGAEKAFGLHYAASARSLLALAASPVPGGAWE
jgi:hypothetical protein